MPYWPSLATCHASCDGGNPSTKSCTSWAYLLVLLSSHQTVVSVFLAKSRVPSQNLWMKRKWVSTMYMIIRVWMELHVPGAPFTAKHVQNVHIIQNECVYHIKYLGSRMVPPLGFICLSHLVNSEALVAVVLRSRQAAWVAVAMDVVMCVGSKPCGCERGGYQGT